jgi:hypothetical protein
MDIIKYETGWEHEMRDGEIDAHAPSEIVLKARCDGVIRIEPKVRDGGRRKARPILYHSGYGYTRVEYKDSTLEYDKISTIYISDGDTLT